MHGVGGDIAVLEHGSRHGRIGLAEGAWAVGRENREGLVGGAPSDRRHEVADPFSYLAARLGHDARADDVEYYVAVDDGAAVVLHDAPAGAPDDGIAARDDHCLLVGDARAVEVQGVSPHDVDVTDGLTAVASSQVVEARVLDAGIIGVHDHEVAAHAVGVRGRDTHVARQVRDVGVKLVSCGGVVVEREGRGEGRLLGFHCCERADLVLGAWWRCPFV